jgi:sugar phosphate permease
MQELPTLNTPIINIPGAKKHRAPWSLVIIAIIAFIIGLVFWLTSRDVPVTTYSETPQEKLRKEVATILENAKVQASQADVNRVTNALSQTKSSASDTEKARVSALLENF